MEEDADSKAIDDIVMVDLRTTAAREVFGLPAYQLCKAKILTIKGSWATTKEGETTKTKPEKA